MHSIDINCDLGEGGGFDEQLMQYISSCNIACGGHYGDEKTISKTIDLAIKNNVKIGAHPSYPDKTNFGRQSLDISPAQLKKELRNQILNVKIQAEEKGERLHHIKPHGALYNDIVRDKKKAQIVIESILEIDDKLILFVPPRSVVKAEAEKKLNIWTEGFADRNYNVDFSLVSRKRPEALLTKKEDVFERILSVVLNGKIQSINGKKLTVNIDTLCLHSDSPNVVKTLQFVSKKLNEKAIKIS